jgi:hypothetical protein
MPAPESLAPDGEALVQLNAVRAPAPPPQGPPSPARPTPSRTSRKKDAPADSHDRNVGNALLSSSPSKLVCNGGPVTFPHYYDACQHPLPYLLRCQTGPACQVLGFQVSDHPVLALQPGTCPALPAFLREGGLALFDLKPLGDDFTKICFWPFALTCLPSESRLRPDSPPEI